MILVFSRDSVTSIHDVSANVSDAHRVADFVPGPPNIKPQAVAWCPWIMGGRETCGLQVGSLA